MAPPTTIGGSLTDALVASLVPPNTASPKLRRIRDNFNRRLRHHSYARTNQFEVAERLGGLQEKFLVLNRDDLADALHVRLGELKKATPTSEKWLPDALHLLLLLSNDPAQKANVDGLSGDKSYVEVAPPPRWADIEAEDPVDRTSKIWETPDFSDLSSDEDAVIRPSKPLSPDGLPKNERSDEILLENTDLVDRDPTSKNDDELARKQIWRAGADTEIVIDELEAVRETMFMLQGLPTTLFWRIDRRIEIDQRFRLNHASHHLLREVLETFANIGFRIDCVRTWLKKPQIVPFMQSLRAGIEQRIVDFDSCISAMQSRLLAPQRFTVVSLAKTLEDVMEQSKLALQLAHFLQQVTASSADNVECLDLLYTTVCSCQASGADDDLLEPLRLLFVKTFEAYLQPILRWIECGEVESSLKSGFVDETTREKSLSGLWHEWYKLNNDPGARRTPRLLQPLVHRIFITGKTKVFLRHLPRTGPDHLSDARNIVLTEIHSIRPSGLLLFSETFEAAITHTIGSFHRSASAQLREKLGRECGLWQTLDALCLIFLGKLGSASDAIDARIFDRIDQGNRAWNDRYLLTETWRNTIQGMDSIDAARVVVYASRHSSRDMQSQRRSVKMLENIALDYILPWPVANMIPDGALKTYKRIWNFLFQIRRARYVLERRCRLAVMTGRLDLSLGEQRLAQGIHHQLLIFVNHLYDHLTLSTIEPATIEMGQKLAAAIDVDGMIHIHHSCMSRLEEICLVSRRVATIKKAVVIVLDLCIRFSDTVTSPVGRRSSIDAHSFKSASSRLPSRPRRQSTSKSSSDEESSDSEGFSTFITFDENSYEGELSDIKQQFQRQRSFIVAGLKSVGRIEEQSTGWNTLAERLDWKTSQRR
jgi:gamma-tubulin complex component 5